MNIGPDGRQEAASLRHPANPAHAAATGIATHARESSVATSAPEVDDAVSSSPMPTCVRQRLGEVRRPP
ncbi:MAG: hypothetical protein ACTIKK_04680 [Agrococcus casei]|uniref:hypothetical protein n=1 Tax=Agrococcus casei TaxID=343512 RepID=UPI003F953FC1